MTLKKMLLLASMALTAIAFAAPAMAQADKWYTDVPVGEGEFEEVELGGSEGAADTVELTGTLISTKFPLRQSCAVHVKANLWNNGGTTATGKVEAIQYTTPCTVEVFNATLSKYVEIAGCEITEVESEGFPWHVNVATGPTGIDIEGANFTNTYNGCAALGIANGGKRGASGTATGTWSNGCISFNEDGDLETTTLPKEAVTLDGSVCNSNVTLK